MPVGNVSVTETPVLLNQEVKTERLKDYEIDKEEILNEEDNLSVFQSSSVKIVDTSAETDSQIPPRINLDVPFTSQAPEKNWEEPWQDACEEAAVLMLDAYYKGYGLSPLFARDELLKMVAWEEARGWGLSIEMEKMKTLTAWYMGIEINGDNEKIGLPAQSGNNEINRNSEEIGNNEIRNKKLEIIENPTVEEIKGYVAGGKPILVVAYGKILPNPHFRNGGPEYHALIIRGYTEDSFITNDPGTQFGENFVYKYNDLLNAIHDWNNGDVANGKSVVLVLE